MGRSRKNLEPRSPRCHAHNRDGAQCRNFAIRGTTVCRMHGGSTTATRNKAAHAVAVAVNEAKLARFLEQNGYEPVENPLEALRELAGEIVTVKDWLRSQVTHLDHESKVQGEQISALMQLYSNFLDKSDRVLVNIAKLNIDERLSNIQQHQAQVMAQVMGETILKILNDKDQQLRARVIVGELLQKYDK